MSAGCAAFHTRRCKAALEVPAVSQVTDCREMRRIESGSQPPEPQPWTAADLGDDAAPAGPWRCRCCLTTRPETDRKVCCRTQQRDCPPTMFGASGQESAMRTYLETIAIIIGLMGAYFALLPLTI
jgi:hypothetical protein